MRVRFWGTRGSLPKPGPSTLRYGGNTSCVEVRTDAGDLVVLDAGSGIHELGLDLVRSGEAGRDGHLLIGHTHWDHIQGFPFFAPLFSREGRWDVFAPGGRAPTRLTAHDDFPVQQVVLGVLSGGMGARLFTEVREKQGLAYWVSAWQETPRKYGMMFLGASTTPERCDRTYRTLLSEVDRLADDIEPAELQRAITGMVANHVTRGNATRARCALLANDLFFFGRPIPIEEKLDKIRAVTVKDVQRYLHTYPRDELCVVTLGPKKLEMQQTPAASAESPAI